MKTTIELPEDLLTQARKLARREGTTLGSLVEEGLHCVIEARRNRPGAGAFELPTFGGEGELAGRTDTMRDASWNHVRNEIYGDPA